MAYSKTTWVDGDTITADKLNKIEDGVEDALENSGVTPGTYSGSIIKGTNTYLPSFTVDERGRITSASNTGTTIPTLEYDMSPGLMTRALYNHCLKAPSNWYDFGKYSSSSPLFIHAGSTSVTQIISSETYMEYRVGIFDVVARDKTTGEKLIVDWSASVTSAQNASTLTVSIAEPYEHDITIIPIYGDMLYGH